MQQPAPKADWLTRPRNVVLVWSAYTVLWVSQSNVWAMIVNRDRPWYGPVPWALATAIVWGCLTVPIVRFARWKRLDRSTWKRNFPWHIGAILLCAVADASGDQVARALTDMPFAFWSDFFRKLDVVTFYYLIICGVTHAADYHELYRHGELRAAELESELRTSQLEQLKSQLQPHFLFNTLNAVNALIYEDPRAADRVVTRLGELLRMTLALGSVQEMSLEHELEFVRAYLDIQQIRMGSRLRVIIDVPADALQARVPTLLLQPLVENAVIHGIAPLVRGGEVVVAARVTGAELTLTITNDGVRFVPPPRYGIGISNVQQRLARLYGSAQSFTIDRNGAGGTRVEVRLPHRAVETDDLLRTAVS